jgi:dTMP kinase
LGHLGEARETGDSDAGIFENGRRPAGRSADRIARRFLIGSFSAGAEPGFRGSVSRFGWVELLNGLFITFEGTEGCGKSTQIRLLAGRLRGLDYACRVLREPGGTAVGEEIRHTLKHSAADRSMTAEAELLLMNASRAQLVREVIRPALLAGEIVLCDRFYDSTTAYQGYGRGLDLGFLRAVIEFAVEDARPDLTLLLTVPVSVSETRRQKRADESGPLRDRFEESDRDFFLRVEEGYRAIAAAEPERIRAIDGTGSVDAVSEQIWSLTLPRLPKRDAARVSRTRGTSG